MGKHGVLVWDRIFEGGGKAKSAASWQGLGMGHTTWAWAHFWWAARCRAGGQGGQGRWREGKKAAGSLEEDCCGELEAKPR